MSSEKAHVYSDDEIAAQLTAHGLAAWYLDDGWPTTLVLVKAIGYLCEAAYPHAEASILDFDLPSFTSGLSPCQPQLANGPERLSSSRLDASTQSIYHRPTSRFAAHLGMLEASPVPYNRRRSWKSKNPLSPCQQR